MTEAPLFNALAEGPEDHAARWLRTHDGTRLRVAVWNAAGPRGTVLLIPGRTEYVEKYGRTASDLAAAGYATLTLDLRGQGMSDRVAPDRMVGHVRDFAEFQMDIDATLDFARTTGLPQPFHLLGHSMGGCIGLRALMRGLPFARAVFTAPMWGILMPAWQRPLALPLSIAACAATLGTCYAPGTGPTTYVLEAPFDDNTLTTDQDLWDYMRRQALSKPDLALGGPSFAWLRAALVENRALARMASPATPTLTALGSRERVVDPDAILDRMARWPNGVLHRSEGAEHEILMERPSLRQPFLNAAIAHFG